MEKPKFIFPDVQVRQSGDTLELETSVRVPLEDGSGHYFTIVKERSTVKDWDKYKYLQETLCRFNNMVYMSIVMGKFNENLTNQWGQPLHNMDDNLETERERMKRIMLKKTGL